MFEFHGWIRVESTTGRTVWRDDGLYYPDDDALHRELVREIERLDGTIRQCVDLRRTVNGLLSLTLSGLLNHRQESVFQLFEWLAEHGRRSTGVLFTRDDEDNDRGYNFNTHFRVFRLSRGEFHELETLFEMLENPDRTPDEIAFENRATETDDPI